MQFSLLVNQSILLEKVVEQTCETKEERKPGQGRIKSDSTNFKPTLSLFSIGNEQGNITTIFEGMSCGRPVI